MKKVNSIIISEKLLLKRAIEREEELSKDIDGSYTKYHSHLASWYKNIETYLDEIIGVEANNEEEFIEKVSSIDFTNEQIENLIQLKNTPLYKKAIGMEAFEEVEELQDIFDYEIHNMGNTFVYKEKKVVALKTSEELEEEEAFISDKLYQLFQENQISKEEWQDYQRKIFYIYEYFVSEAEGELLFAPRISNSQYKKMEQTTKISNISFGEQLAILIKENREQFKEVQRMQQEYYESNKGKVR